MKKGLLLSMMLLAGASAFAAKDGATYEPKDGLIFQNISMNCALDGTFSKLMGTAFPSLDYVRTATVLGDKVYVASSKAFDGEGSTDQGLIAIFDLNSGEYIQTLQLTVDGTPISGTLCANCIDTDDYGNLWVSGFRGTMFLETSGDPNPITVYTIDPATGACTLQAKLRLNDGDEYASGRVDFIDIAGDVTRREDRCVAMGAPSGADNTYVYGWACDRDSDEWYGHMLGENEVVLTLAEKACYPAVTSFNGGTSVTILPDPDGEFTKFYVDDMNTLPGQFNTDGAAVESFKVLQEDPDVDLLTPKTNPCGVCDFELGGDFYMIYGIEEYDGEQACRANLVRLGEGATFAGMKHLYTFPEAGLGHEKGGPGARVHTLTAKVETDSKGKQGAYIFDYKTGNGFAYYLFAQEGFEGAASVENLVVEDANAPVEYFNLQGIRVANPENGIFIRRQGAKATKVIL